MKSPIAENRKLNARRSIPDKRDFQLHQMHGLVALPQAVDLRPLSPPIYDQGQEGACTSHGWCFAWEFLQLRDIRLAMNPDSDPFEFGTDYTAVSRRFHYQREGEIEGDPGQDNGAQIVTGGKVFAKYGIPAESIWPYDVGNPDFLTTPTPDVMSEAAQHKDRSYYRLANFQCILQSLADGFPVVGGFTLYDSFMSQDTADTGIIPMPQQGENEQGGHCMAFVGYNMANQMLILRNSWGTDWGQAGYAMMPFDYAKDSNLFFDPLTLRPK